MTSSRPQPRPRATDSRPNQVLPASADPLESILDAKNYEFSITASTLASLDSNLIPRFDDTSDDALSNAKQAKAALAVIYAQCKLFLRARTQREKMVRLLDAKHHDILLWIYRLTRQTRQRGRTVGEELDAPGAACVIKAMIRLDPHLHDTILSSPAATRLILSLWKNSCVKEPPLTAAEGPYDCPIVQLLISLLLHTVGRSNIMMLLETSTPTALGLVPTLRRLLRDLLKCRSSAWLMRRLDGIFRVAIILLDPEKEFPEYFIQPLQSPGFVSVFFRIIELALQGDTTAIVLEEITRFVQAGFLLVVGPPRIQHSQLCSPISLAKAALDGGCYIVAIKTLVMLSRSNLPGVGISHSRLLGLLLEMTAYAAFQELVPSLLRAFSSVPSSIIELASKNQAFSQAWGDIDDWIRGRLQSEILMIERTQQAGSKSLTEDICSNPKHPHNPYRVFRSGKCSGCGKVAYCSSLCQKADWDSGHRNECALLKRMGSNRRISLRVQAMMAAFTRWSIEAAFEEIAQGRAAGPMLSRTLVVDVRQIPLGLGIGSVNGLRDRTKGVESRVLEEYLVQLSEDDEIYLVEAYFPWGRYTAHVLVRLKRDGNGVCRPLGAMVLRLLDQHCMDRVLVGSA